MKHLLASWASDLVYRLRRPAARCSTSTRGQGSAHSSSAALRNTPSGPQREAEEERVQELLHWLESERDEARGANAPPVDF